MLSANHLGEIFSCILLLLISPSGRGARASDQTIFPEILARWSIFKAWFSYGRGPIFIQTVSRSHKQTRNLKEEKQPSMSGKAGSHLPALRKNWQDFSRLPNEIPDWTHQSDKVLLCRRRLHLRIPISWHLESVGHLSDLANHFFFHSEFRNTFRIRHFVEVESSVFRIHSPSTETQVCLFPAKSTSSLPQPHVDKVTPLYVNVLRNLRSVICRWWFGVLNVY